MSVFLKILLRFRKSLLCSALLLVTFTWVGCENLRYYNQAINGQYQILTSKRAITKVVADPQTPDDLKKKLRLVVAMRNYAEKELKLPAYGQYVQFADLHRRFVVWNVYAAEEFSLEPKSWTFPIVGKATYRGYFSEKAARQYAEKLKKQGLDVHVGGVEAYSTVGWFHDPVLNTFINNSEIDLAETLFHELAHQTAFAKGDTDFNEAFATAVAEEGLRRWMLSTTNTEAYAEYKAALTRKDQFIRLVMNAREQLERLYAEQTTSANTQLASLAAVRPLSARDKRAMKENIISGLRQDYQKLKASWGGNGEYDNWFNKPINNAKLNTVATYNELVPAFNRLLEDLKGDLPLFYKEVRKIAKLSKDKRQKVLAKLTAAVSTAAERHVEISANPTVRLAAVVRRTPVETGPPDTNSSAQAAINAFLKNEAVRLDSKFLEGVTNRQQWEAQRPAMREQYLEMLGLLPLPERTPLNAKVTGTIDREEGFRVEKLHFQSRPGLYVTGNLYTPADARAGAKLPAVLYVCGHSGRGRDGNKVAFQHHGMWFATHGYVCLVIDTLQLGEIAAIHHGTYRYNRWWWQARGYTPAAVECWNGIRALDYLQSRPEVDPDRIAVTGISGGGAATFWIAAADERVKVAVPASGMSDLQDYVGEKVVNGHCDCMFLINTFQWPWTSIAALVAPRPLLFENSGHDTIFPMNSNDRIRARLERLYGFYTNRTDRLFDIGVTPGGHDDKPELRLMAYRWINHHLKGDDGPVTEPKLPEIEGKQLRAFPDELPSDEINTKIDESFVTMATSTLPRAKEELESWRTEKMRELRRLCFRSLREPIAGLRPLKLDSKAQQGVLTTEPGVTIPWGYFPARKSGSQGRWLVVLGDGDSIESKPEWLTNAVGDAAVLLVAARGSGPMKWQDPPPYYIQRSLPLLGRTVDSCRLLDAVAAAAQASEGNRGGPWKIIGSGPAGIIAAYAALLEPRLTEAVLVDPPASHRDGPIFLNVLRVLDIPEALGLLAPRPLTILTSHPDSFEHTASLYHLAGGNLKVQPIQ